MVNKLAGRSAAFEQSLVQKPGSGDVRIRTLYASESPVIEHTRGMQNHIQRRV
jgi:hypothetical protein